MVKIRLYLDENAADNIDNMELNVESVPRIGEKITVPKSEYKEFTVTDVQHTIENNEMITLVNVKRSAYL